MGGTNVQLLLIKMKGQKPTFIHSSFTVINPFFPSLHYFILSLSISLLPFSELLYAS